jgi:hypothetical protein
MIDAVYIFSCNINIMRFCELDMGNFAEGSCRGGGLDMLQMAANEGK